MGKQQLEGSIVKLKKPLVVMTLQSEEGGREYHAAGVVRQKFVFKTRPVPAVVVQVAPPKVGDAVEAGGAEGAEAAAKRPRPNEVAAGGTAA